MSVEPDSAPALVSIISRVSFRPRRTVAVQLDHVEGITAPTTCQRGHPVGILLDCPANPLRGQARFEESDEETIALE